MQSLLSKEETTWRIIPRTVIDTCGVKSSACKIVLHVHRYNSKINQKIRIISEQKKSLVFTCNHLSVKIIVEDLRFNCETIRRENSESQGEMKKIGEHKRISHCYNKRNKSYVRALFAVCMEDMNGCPPLLPPIFPYPHPSLPLD